MSELGWICLAGGSLGVLAHYLRLRSQLWIVISTGASYLMILLVPALCLLALAANPVGIVVSAVLLLLAAYSQLPLYRTQPARGTGPSIRLMTANLLFKAAQADPARFVATVAEHQVDVLMLQELTHLQLDQLRAAGLDDLLTHSFVKPGRGGEGTGLWSRFALTEAQSEPGFGFEVLSARAALTDALSIWLLSVHLQPPWPRRPAGWLAELPRLGSVLRGLSPGAVLAAGDLNATWDHSQFRRILQDGYFDAGVQSRFGSLRSWPASRFCPPLIGIDHILVRSAWARTVRRVRVAGSDHLGLVAEIALDVIPLS